jgi:dienelactone hydrolase
MIQHISVILAAGMIALVGPIALPPAATAQQHTTDAAAADAAYDALPDTPGTGRYPAARFVDPRLPDHVIYRPATRDARRLGVVVWGNGGCSDDGASARQHLAEIASHGYVVIAPGRILSGPGGPPRPAKRPPPGPLGIRTTTADVAAGIDWALAENRRAGSPLFGRIDPRAIAVSGHSCGGLQALQLAADPRVNAAIIHNSGVFKDGGNPIRGMTIDKSVLARLHTPVLYVMGGPGDVAWPNGNDDFDRIATVPAAIASLDVGHGGTFRDVNGGRVAPVAVAWLEWQLRGDTTAARWFKGPACRLCTDRAWTLRKKRID